MPSPQAPPANAFILGLDTPAGAYLARLLHARGQQVSGLAAHGPSLLAALGAQDDITELAQTDLQGAGTLYIIAQNHPQVDRLTEETIAAAPESLRLVHVVDEDLLRAHAPARARLKTLIELRQNAGRFAATAVLHAHDSRLGPVTNLPAQLSIAAFHAAQNSQNIPPISETGAPRSWGWTPEYVDAVARLAALPAATDAQISSGVPLSAQEMAQHAATFFKLPPDHAPLAMPPKHTQQTPDLQADPHPERLKTLLGWRAYTTGADLMAALCEAAPERASRANPDSASRAKPDSASHAGNGR